MKKHLKTIASAVALMTLANVTAFAENIQVTPAGDTTREHQIQVFGTPDAEPGYSVTITWETHTPTYVFSQTSSTWDTENHTYTKSEPDTKPTGWYDDLKKESLDTREAAYLGTYLYKVRIENHSNTYVKASMTDTINTTITKELGSACKIKWSNSDQVAGCRTASTRTRDTISDTVIREVLLRAPYRDNDDEADYGGCFTSQDVYISGNPANKILDLSTIMTTTIIITSDDEVVNSNADYNANNLSYTNEITTRKAKQFEISML